VKSKPNSALKFEYFHFTNNKQTDVMPKFHDKSGIDFDVSMDQDEISPIQLNLSESPIVLLKNDECKFS
jgi:hypothetical protein